MGSCDSGFICPASMLLGAVIDYTPRCVWMDIEESQWVVTGAALMANMNHDRLNTFLPSFLHSSFNHSFTVRNHPPLSGSSNLRFRSWEFSPHHTLTNDRLDLCWGVGAVNIRKGQNPHGPHPSVAGSKVAAIMSPAFCTGRWHPLCPLAGALPWCLIAIIAVSHSCRAGTFTSFVPTLPWPKPSPQPGSQ